MNRMLGPTPACPTVHSTVGTSAPVLSEFFSSLEPKATAGGSRLSLRFSVAQRQPWADLVLFLCRPKLTIGFPRFLHMGRRHGLICFAATRKIVFKPVLFCGIQGRSRALPELGK